MSPTLIFLCYPVVGAFAGLLSGLLGIGGGLVVVPSLAFLLARTHQVPLGDTFHFAVGTSLATVIVTAMSSAVTQARFGMVDWRLVAKLLPGLLVGAFVGVAIADALSGHWLKMIFAAFVLLIAVRMWLPAPMAQHVLPRMPWLLPLSSAMGAASAILGIGLGSFGVPFLLRCGIPIRRAAAVIVTCTPPVVACATVGFLWVGRQTVAVPDSWGYVYWPAWSGIVVGSVSCAPFGVKLAHKLPTRVLRKVFACFLIVVSLALFFSRA